VLGPDAAAEIYRVLLDHVLAEACATGLPVTLALADSMQLSDWRAPDGACVEVQAEGDLGRRMHTAFERRFAAGAQAVVLVGSDLPAISASHLREAIAALSRVPVVLGPAEDGGYWLIGQQAPGFDLFSGVVWSAAETLAATRGRIATLGVAHEETAVLNDLDTVRDLETILTDGHLNKELRMKLGRAAGRAPGSV
jgi:rSAM/selenodomain-associated transferase 1